MSWALMIGKGGYARKEFNSAAPGYSRCLFAARCTLLCELSGDGCGDPPTGLRNGTENSLIREMRSRMLAYRCHSAKSDASLVKRCSNEL
jgi:hypothetical protein